MSNEVVEWFKELWLEFKLIPADFKALIGGVNSVKVNMKNKSNVRPVINREEIVVKHEGGGSSWLVKACLLYLCVFITVIGVGFLSFLLMLNESLPVGELSYYAGKGVEFFKRVDDMGGGDRFLGWLYQYDELPYWAGAVEWRNINDSLMSDVS